MWLKLIEQLQLGNKVSFRPRGQSMTGKIESGNLVTLSPASEYDVGDIVLSKINGHFYLHLISAKRGKQFQISNNKGFINGWTTKIFGKVIAIQK